MSDQPTCQTGPCSSCSCVFINRVNDPCGACDDQHQSEATGIPVPKKVYCHHCGVGYPRMKEDICYPCKQISNSTPAPSPHPSLLLRHELNQSLNRVNSSPVHTNTSSIMAEIDELASDSYQSASHRRKLGTNIRNSLTVGKQKITNSKFNDTLSRTQPRLPLGQGSHVLSSSNRNSSMIPANVQSKPKVQFVPIRFVYQFSNKSIEHGLGSITQSVDFKDSSWFTKLAEDAYNFYSEKAYERFPTEDQTEDGFPPLPHFDIRWVQLVQVTYRSVVVFSSEDHLLQAFKDHKKASNMAWLGVLFNADDYLVIQAKENELVCGSKKRKIRYESEDPHSDTNYQYEGSSNNFRKSKQNRLDSPSDQTEDYSLPNDDLSCSTRLTFWFPNNSTDQVITRSRSKLMTKSVGSETPSKVPDDSQDLAFDCYTRSLISFQAIKGIIGEPVPLEMMDPVAVHQDAPQFDHGIFGVSKILRYRLNSSKVNDTSSCTTYSVTEEANLAWIEVTIDAASKAVNKEDLSDDLNHQSWEGRISVGPQTLSGMIITPFWGSVLTDYDISNPIYKHRLFGEGQRLILSFQRKVNCTPGVTSELRDMCLSLRIANSIRFMSQMAFSMLFQSIDSSFDAKFFFCQEKGEEEEELYMTPANFVLKKPYENMHQIMHALSHSSLDDYEGKAVIVVLKGAGQIVTDLSMINLKWPVTKDNQGKAAIKEFQSSHCPPLCDLLGLHKLNLPYDTNEAHILEDRNDL
ncbi:uncharacterized protein MELLADRAFT_63104 [Melampsora larici-populina 98AG31]|uniref:Alpha-type protein kinase domain-containing protein n=1 Tax=Melampsora larici-populina (strain 98AG31 / pathotype 3-4-7) TaxID=747676 RepID=F4RLB1_MELLP|nr:uncharacterized protein MELLADRAFT_63104 [Melampsora larici-populina 98AG31]EGG06879.1 hypothetical protein MELLADRAFT_63104 [Melampsora larici-populina 98AG31]